MDSLDPRLGGLDLSKIPISQPPPGVIPNFENPPSIAGAVIAIGVIMVVLTMSFVMLRLYSNHHAKRKYRLDDYTCILATVFFLAVTGVDIDLRRYGRHDYDIPITWINSAYIKKVFLIDILAGPSYFLAKASLFLLYYRVFALKKLMRTMIICGVVFALLVYIVVMVPVVGTLCTPRIGHEWDFRVLLSCRRALTYGVVQAVSNLSLDLFILALPIPAIVQLQLPMNQKIGVFAIFMTGLFAIIASIIALVYRVKLLSAFDVEWGVSNVQICIFVENGVTIMCSSMPASAYVFRLIAQKSKLYNSIRSFILSRCKSSSQNQPSFVVSKPYLPADHEETHSHLRGKGYFELSGPRGSNAHGISNDSGASGFDAEKGFITKPANID